MKMPEPIAYMDLITGQLAEVDDAHRVRFPLSYRPLYGKQALIDLLEDAAKECEYAIRKLKEQL